MRKKNETAPAPILPDYLAPGLDVIFVGAAPSLSSEQVGHYYAGPTNKFWKLLHQGGFTPRLLHTSEDSEVLRYGIGLTGIFKNLSTSAVHLLPTPTEAHREILRAKLHRNAPALGLLQRQRRLSPLHRTCLHRLGRAGRTGRLFACVCRT